MHIRLFFFVITLIGTIQVSAQSYYQRGYRSVTFNDPSRSGRAIATDLYYPANTTGTNVALASGTARFPIVVFGHGFSLPASAYIKLADTLTRYGYIAAFPTTESGLSPSHDQFGKDLSFLCTTILQLDADPASFLFQRLTPKAAVGGHSMGGGCSFLAAASGNTNIHALFNMAAAETTPSAISAASTVNIPSLLFSGSNDCIVPPATQSSMYTNIPNSCKSQVTITGATHCQMADNNFTCVFGQISSGCNSSPISVNTVYTKTTELLIPFLDYTLNGVCLRGVDYVNKLNTLSGITAVSNCPIPSCSVLPISIQRFSGYFSNKVTLTVDVDNNAPVFDNLFIEKSSDGLVFKPWTTVRVNPAYQKIQLTDADFFKPISYYRLKFVNGSFINYSSIVAIKTEQSFSVRLLNNPIVSRQLQLTIKTALAEPIQIRLFSTDGKSLFQSTVNITNNNQLLTIPIPAALRGLCLAELRLLKSHQVQRLSFFSH